MRAFRYHRPATVQEAARLVADLGEDAVLLAGGTSVMTMARLGLAEPEHAVALAGIPELSGVEGSPENGLTFGAMTTLREVETSPLVTRLAPGLAEAAGHVATVRIRNQATVGGNLVHADPNQDLPPMLMVYDAVARLTGPEGTREVPVADMFVDFFESVVRPDEILHSVWVPPAALGTTTGYVKFLPRTRDDYSTISVAAGLTVVDGRIERARIAVAGGGATAVRCRAAESALVGRSAEDGTLSAAADLVPQELDPIGDGRGSAAYKSDMARVCTRRLLRQLVSEPRA
jgi:carbon-monoxide dehydrogenase medium subunit